MWSGFKESFWGLDIVHNTSDSGHKLNGLNGIIVSAAGILKVKNNLGGRVF